MAYSYVAFLRGINVGGNSLIKMDALRAALTDCGLESVTTYIQSGNVLFESHSKDEHALGKQIEACIKKYFKLDVAVAVFNHGEWQRIISNAPGWWGKTTDWRHNIFVVVTPDSAEDIAQNIGQLKPEFEKLFAGNRVLYQSIALAGIGRGATGSKLASNKVYKQISIRNYNTATKLATLL